MASLVSSGEKAALSRVFDDVFDTFKRDVTIYKESVKILSSVSEANIFGYGDPKDPSDIDTFAGSPKAAFLASRIVRAFATEHGWGMSDAYCIRQHDILGWG